MERYEGLARPFTPDWEALVATIRRQGPPHRVHNVELFQDPEISDAIAGRFDLLKGLAASDPDYTRKKRLAIQRFCGFDYITVSVDLEMPVFRQAVADTAALRRPAGRDPSQPGPQPDVQKSFHHNLAGQGAGEC